jgi:hypothetical protein
VNCLHKIFHSRMPLSAHRFLNHCIAKWFGSELPQDKWIP